MTANAATGRGFQPARVGSDEIGRTAVEPLESADGRIGPDRKKPVCIVVEDDITMRHLVMNYLEEHDIRAIAASRRDEVSALPGGPAALMAMGVLVMRLHEDEQAARDEFAERFAQFASKSQRALVRDTFA